jgi:2-dehydro-3-deoxygluconokinase
VSLDVNHRAALWTADEAGPVLADLATRVDVLFAGDDEAGLLGATGEPEAMVKALAAHGPGQVVLKLGARGAVAALDGDLVQVPAFGVVVVDAVGAGDAFVGGYLAELLLGADPLTRLRTATACGAFAVTVPGDWEGLPTRRDLQLLSTPEGTVVR